MYQELKLTQKRTRWIVFLSPNKKQICNIYARLFVYAKLKLQPTTCNIEIEFLMRSEK